MTENDIPMTESEIDDALKEYVDPEAPYGRFRNGNPRKRPAKNVAITVASPARKAPKPKKPTQEAPDYVAIARANVQLLGGLVGIAATATKRATLAMDSATLIVHAEPMAQGWGQAALDDARIARWLEKVGSIGTVSAALAPTIAVFAQIMVNHGRLPAGAMGTLAPDALMARAEQLATEAAGP